MTIKQQPLYLPKATVVFAPNGKPVGNINWTADEKVLPCVQKKNIECGLPTAPAFNPVYYSRRKLLSKFHAEEDQPCSGNTIMLGDEIKTDKPANLKEKQEPIPGIYGTSLPVSNFSHQVSHVYGCSAEKKFQPPEDKLATEGVLTSPFYKDHYKAAMEQLAALNITKNSRTAQLNSNISKQGQFHSWNYVCNQGKNAVNRDLSKPCPGMPSGSSDVPINLISTNPLVHSFMKRYHPVTYPETRKTTLEKSSRNGDGDFLKKTNEATASDSYPATDSSGDDMQSANKWKLKKRNGNVESKLLVEEKDATESEKKNKALLNYFKNLNLNLKPEPIEHKEDVSSSSLDNDTFPYPDFLPSPYNNLDLQKISSKSGDWKSSLNPPLNDSLDKLVSRLVEMERLQHLTILRERTRETVSPAMAANNRTISTKEFPLSKQPRPPDCSCSCQATVDGDTHNSSCGRQETNIPKCTCQHCHNHKNSTSIRSPSKLSRASCSNFKCTKAPVILSSSNVTARRSTSCSGSSSKIRSGAKLQSADLSSPSTNTACYLPESESSKYKQTRTKRPLKRGSLTSRFSQFQKLKSNISKQKSPNVDLQ